MGISDIFTVFEVFKTYLARVVAGSLPSGSGCRSPNVSETKSFILSTGNRSNLNIPLVP